MANQERRQKFTEVVEEHYESIFRGAISVSGDRHVAEEIVQETFVSAFRKFDSFSGRSSVFSWLYGIMLNKYRDHCRRMKRLRRLGFVRRDTESSQAETALPTDFSPYAELANSDESALLMKAVSKLPTKLRLVVAMRYFDGLSLKEVAKTLNCRLGTVKSRLSRARERLLRILERDVT